ncbi:hypothetical protein FALBO_11450 [Fusarium albosuccineum]|uniref:Uncharacterized protein n=1 Tax=Fusarium albosuccineum TaxID=1237068 RepID=A0A8H4L570_9HYPO|nr:hypothetical protein FALBO_11450 [Fusarium albosuccineum]
MAHDARLPLFLQALVALPGAALGRSPPSHVRYAPIGLAVLGVPDAILPHLPRWRSRPSQDDYQKAIERNLKVFALAQMWTKISMNLLVFDPEPEFGQCISEPSTRVGDKCMQFKYRDGTTAVTLATGEHPRDAAGAIASTGLNFDTVANNAIDCQNAGKTFSDADFEGFLAVDSSDEQAIPACLFGLPVINV